MKYRPLISTLCCLVGLNCANNKFYSENFYGEYRREEQIENAQLEKAFESMSDSSFEAKHGNVIETESLLIEEVLEKLKSCVYQSGIVTFKGFLNSENPNAYMRKNGNLYFTLGAQNFLCSEEDIASVVSHEISHFNNPRIYELGEKTINGRFAEEINADSEAVYCLIESGYDPISLIDVIEKFRDYQMEGLADARIENIRKILDDIK